MVSTYCSRIRAPVPRRCVPRVAELRAPRGTFELTPTTAASVFSPPGCAHARGDLRAPPPARRERFLRAGLRKRRRGGERQGRDECPHRTSYAGHHAPRGPRTATVLN